jgi:chorismate synthase
MKIETDQAKIITGVRRGLTLGAPLSLMIENRDWENWQTIMCVESRVKSKTTQTSKLQTPDSRLQAVTRPRPGHADLTGALKYDHRDIRNVLERSSARETAARVALGAIAKKLLGEFGMSVMSYVTEIGGIRYQISGDGKQVDEKKLSALFKKAEASEVRCPDKKTEEEMIASIKKAIKNGDSLGGVFEVIVKGVPAGLGSYTQWDRRLSGKLAYAMMGSQAMKGVEIGLGFEAARRSGSEVMDEIYYRAKNKEPRTKTDTSSLSGGFHRKTNNAGGIEGGMSNGMPIIIRAAMKPIPTLKSPLSSVDINTKKKFRAAYERSDVCAVPAASVIGEAVAALVIADSFLYKFGGDSIAEIRRNYKGYLEQINSF